ncbi:hypothetical protein SAMN04488498_101396 [Mesorhizobium albiziae]|uniref:Uncharacterized protein n=1 Tax=Neomesorhizobium albiziae TaxID=335020 RepID=A0A1I3VHL4_9HYPH|nr:hypothetical protein [Mesorhizobium albiziae]GLS28854.1 hypothetical protein GCM10007937_05610 [Mesorhizobium albiziae]SFJ93631.1 hypothetical protein SAMN04488498_101396 [Mesorhizobium albiziae]
MCEEPMTQKDMARGLFHRVFQICMWLEESKEQGATVPGNIEDKLDALYRAADDWLEPFKAEMAAAAIKSIEQEEAREAAERERRRKNSRSPDR